MIIRFLLLLAALATQAPAQAVPLRTRILTLSLDARIENVFFQSGGEVHPFEADRSGFGEPLKYVGTQRFIVRASAEEFAVPSPAPPPLASVMLPEKARLVLLVGARAAEDKLKLAAYDISPDGFQAGDYHLFNFSTRALSVIFDTHKFVLQPGADRLVSEASWRSGAADIPIRIAHLENGKPRRVFASVWGHQSVKRNYVFFFNGSHPTRPVGIRRFSDYPE